MSIYSACTDGIYLFYLFVLSGTRNDKKSSIGKGDVLRVEVMGSRLFEHCRLAVVLERFRVTKHFEKLNNLNVKKFQVTAARNY